MDHSTNIIQKKHFEHSHMVAQWKSWSVSIVLILKKVKFQDTVKQLILVNVQVFTATLMQMVTAQK